MCCNAAVWVYVCRWHQLHAARQRNISQAQSTADAWDLPNEFDDIHPLVNPTPPKVALLIRAEDGAVRSSQTNLATAVTRRVRHAHVLSLSYSTHKDKGDSLLLFDSTGQPLQASFLATTVFRDAFTAI